MNLKDHLDALQLDNNGIAKEARLSYVTIRYIMAGKPLGKSATKALLDALSRKYGRKVERAEIEGLNIDETLP